jgi:hypothetical protein
MFDETLSRIVSYLSSVIEVCSIMNLFVTQFYHPVEFIVEVTTNDKAWVEIG